MKKFILIFMLFIPLIVYGNGLGGNALGKTWQISFVIDAGASAISTGAKGYLRIPYSGTITGWELTSPDTGSIVIDIWKGTYGTFPPVDAGSIAGSELPTLSGVLKNQDLNLTTWTTRIVAGDYLRINVDSASTVKYIFLSILITRD